MAAKLGCNKLVSRVIMNQIRLNRKKVILLFIVLTIAAITVITWRILTGSIAGGIVYKINNDYSISYLLITTKNGDKWIFPKGKVRFYESTKQAAIREVAEESGVYAKIIYKLDGNPFIYYKSSGNPQKIVVYAMEYYNEAKIWQEKNERNRKWMSLKECEMVLSAQLFMGLQEVHNRLNNNYHKNEGNRE